MARARSRIRAPRAQLLLWQQLETRNSRQTTPPESGLGRRRGARSGSRSSQAYQKRILRPYPYESARYTGSGVILPARQEQAVWPPSRLHGGLPKGEPGELSARARHFLQDAILSGGELHMGAASGPGTIPSRTLFCPAENYIWVRHRDLARCALQEWSEPACRKAQYSLREFSFSDVRV